MRNKIVSTAQSLIGKKEADGSHRIIIDVYNSITPLPSGYKMSYSDPWCAAFVSALGQYLGITDIVLPECGCDRMIRLYQNVGRWVESDSYVPAPGDLVFYDWQDSGIGDNTGSSDHVGLVETVSGSSMTVIEGNISDSVGRRNLAINGRYIRGYAVPDYAESTPQETPFSQISGTISTGSVSDEKIIWDFLMREFNNAFGVAGLMGNLYKESGLKSDNIENAYESKIGANDASYTAAVDNGSYGNFVKDSVGYGIAQWTFWSRKQALLNYARQTGRSIGDLTMQLEFLVKELKGSFKPVYSVLIGATSILEASNYVLIHFENPANKGEAVQAERFACGQNYYNKYASGVQSPTIQQGAVSGGVSVSSGNFKVGDVVSIAPNATYYSGATIPAWVKNKEWIIASINGDRVIIDKSVDGKNSIMSPVCSKYLISGSTWVPQIGDIVVYNGNVHYASAVAVNGHPCTGGKAKITQIYQLGKSKHPYHLVKIPGGGSTVYGWVDDGSFSKA